jgi:hypothetical protein
VVQGPSMACSAAFPSSASSLEKAASIGEPSQRLHRAQLGGVASGGLMLGL